MSKIKEKLNDSICFVKENPIEGLAKVAPVSRTINKKGLKIK